MRCSPEENRVAKGEAVAGKGFLRTGDDEVDDIDERVAVRVRRVNDGTGSLELSFCSCSGDCLGGGRMVEGSSSDG